MKLDLKDIRGEKKLRVVKVHNRVLDSEGRVWDAPWTPFFPMDSQAKYAFYSKMGGPVPVEAAIESIASNVMHYATGGFEGVRICRTIYGDAFPELAFNIARLVYSSLAFNQSLITETMKLSDAPGVHHVEHLQRTAREFFEDSISALIEGRPISMRVAVYKNGDKIEEAVVPFTFMVKVGKEERAFSMQEMQAAICSLAFLNKLARIGKFPENEIRLVLAGYFRPFFWISGEDGLKVPTIYREDRDSPWKNKTSYFGIITAPWGKYLDEDGYSTGIKVITAPFRRIDTTMPVRQKIDGDYNNSARNINPALRLGYQEILALNHNDEFVEGSAENLVMLMKNNRTGELRAYCPPLSADILAGTNRDRVIRILEEGLVVEGKRVKLVMEALKRDFVLASLEGRTGWDVAAIVLMGTGVGLIHVRELADNPELRKWMECNELRSEETEPYPLFLRKVDETTATYKINGGVRHPFVDALNRAFTNCVLEGDGRRVTPAYDIGSLDNMERVLGLDRNDFTTADFRRKVDSGYFKVKVNGVAHPDEINKRYVDVYKTMAKAVERSIARRVSAPRSNLALRA